MRTYRTFSSRETKTLAAVLAEKALKARGHRRTAKVLALQGDLGAGKTTFVQGFLKAMGVRGRVTSPTFVLMKRFSMPSAVAKRTRVKSAYHIDAYRFRKPNEAAALGLKEVFADPEAVVLVEWPERLKEILPRGAGKIRFRHGRAGNERVIIAP
jgi:tRNA threonylcarbamoyladenosine biosynthesis protein TsaE